MGLLGSWELQLFPAPISMKLTRPWQKSLPAFAGLPDALELPKHLLIYTPSARLHPAKALCSVFFAILPEDDEMLGHLPKQIFDFTGAELTTLPVESRNVLLGFASRYSEKNSNDLQARTPSAEVLPSS